MNREELYPVPSIIIANYFIKKAMEDNYYMNQLKLLKLVYISHCWYLACTDRLLIIDSVEAWRYGPIIPNLYKYTKKFSRFRITEPLMIEDTYWKNSLVDIDFLEAIWRNYSKFSGLQLSSLVNKEGSVWDQVQRECGGGDRSGPIIPNDMMRRYYKNLLEK